MEDGGWRMERNLSLRHLPSSILYPRLSALPLARTSPWCNVPGPMATPESNKVIYSMTGVSKRYEKKVILENIYLSYFYGAKIGVLGLNGAGKSSLLKILAGVDKNFEGQIQVSPGYTI